jgi:hypothetical protein
MCFVKKVKLNHMVSITNFHHTNFIKFACTQMKHEIIIFWPWKEHSLKNNTNEVTTMRSIVEIQLLRIHTL